MYYFSVGIGFYANLNYRCFTTAEKKNKQPQYAFSTDSLKVKYFKFVAFSCVYEVFLFH